MSAEAPSPQVPKNPTEPEVGDATDTSEVPSLSVVDGGKESRKSWFRLLRRNKTGSDERHLRAVPDLPRTPEHGHGEPTTLSLEQQRDFAAIETFLKLNNDYFARRAGQPNRAGTSARDAAVAYDHAMEIKIPEPAPIKETEPTPTYASMRAGLTEAPSLRGDPLSEDFIKLVNDAMEAKIKKAWDDHDPNNDIDDFIREAEEIKKQYSLKQHKEHSWHDRQLQLSPDDKDNHYFTVEDRGLKNLEILDGYTPAILASIEARQKALAEGKTLEEAQKIGGTEYERVVKEMEDKDAIVRMSPKDRRKSAAIYAFNKAKNKVTREGMRLVGNAQYGLDLRNNALKEFERVMNMDLKFFEHDYDKPTAGTREATTTSPTSPNRPITSGGASSSLEQNPTESANSDDSAERKEESRKLKLQELGRKALVTLMNPSLSFDYFLTRNKNKSVDEIAFPNRIKNKDKAYKVAHKEIDREHNKAEKQLKSEQEKDKQKSRELERKEKDKADVLKRLADANYVNKVLYREENGLRTLKKSGFDEKFKHNDDYIYQYYKKFRYDRIHYPPKYEPELFQYDPPIVEEN